MYYMKVRGNTRVITVETNPHFEKNGSEAIIQGEGEGVWQWLGVLWGCWGMGRGVMG